MHRHKLVGGLVGAHIIYSSDKRHGFSPTSIKQSTDINEQVHISEHLQLSAVKSFRILLAGWHFT
jgi:hypothetical protein